jgi:hypothetical protein
VSFGIENTFVPGFVIAAALRITKLLLPRGDTKIGNSIIHAVCVDVVDLQRMWGK